jgi:hypothetical protein
MRKNNETESNGDTETKQKPKDREKTDERKREIQMRDPRSMTTSWGEKKERKVKE